MNIHPSFTSFKLQVTSFKMKRQSPGQGANRLRRIREPKARPKISCQASDSRIQSDLSDQSDQSDKSRNLVLPTGTMKKVFRKSYSIFSSFRKDFAFSFPFAAAFLSHLIPSVLSRLMSSPSYRSCPSLYIASTCPPSAAFLYNG